MHDPARVFKCMYFAHHLPFCSALSVCSLTIWSGVKLRHEILGITLGLENCPIPLSNIGTGLLGSSGLRTYMYKVTQTGLSASPPASGDLIGNYSENYDLVTKVETNERCHAIHRIEFARKTNDSFKLFLRILEISSSAVDSVK